MFRRERTRQGNSWRMSVICIEEIATFKLRLLDVLRLESCGGHMLFGERTSLLKRRLVPDSAGTTFIGNVIVNDRCVVDNSLVYVSVVNDRSVYVNDGCIVDEIAIVPFAAYKANAHVAKPVIYTTVVADVPSPITGMKDIQIIVIPSPIGRCPECSLERRWNPGSGNPIVLLRVVVICPIPWNPDEVRLRARGLNVHGQWRRSEANADKHASVCGLSEDQRNKCE